MTQYKRHPLIFLTQFDLVFPDKRCIYKAPSGRELSPQVTEGECANMKILENMRFAGSFHHFVALSRDTKHLGRRESLMK